jgi:guanylate kinase
MNLSAPILHRGLKRERDNFLPGTVVSFTTLMHPGARFPKKPRMIGLVELEDGRRILAPLLGENVFIGQTVYPRMRLSHITEEKLRVYGVSFEARTHVSKASEKFPGYILALTGPSGVGKSTISRMLTKTCAEYTERVPILTTRAPKAGDDGEYIYVSKKEFDHLKKAGEIVASTEILSSGENRNYGYRAGDIEAIWAKDKVPVVVTEMSLLEDLSTHYGRRSMLSFGLLPPGKSKRAMLSQLLHRLRTRGRETEEHVQDRIKNAERDLAFFNERKDLFDHMVVNTTLATTIASMKKKVMRLAGT